MRKVHSTREMVARAGHHVGIILSLETLIDAEWSINQAVASGIPFGVALYRWWSVNITAYRVEPQTCAHCQQSFLNWDWRPRKFCCEDHKRAAENARWYQSHRETVIRQVISRRRNKRK